MRDERGHVGPTPSLLRTGRLNRRRLLQASGAVVLAGPFGVAARRAGVMAQDTGDPIIRSASRQQVMKEIVAAYPDLRPDGAPEGGTVIVANLGGVDSFNPVLGGNLYTFDILSLIYEGLVGVHPIDGSIVPGLADFELAADEVTYTFRIHPDARFHDGAPVTAADAAFTYEMILAPSSFSLSAFLQEVLKSYRAVDDRTFEMVSNGPIASFLYDAALFSVVPKHVWESVPPEDWPSDPGSTGEDAARVVGSGPFMFEEWVPDDHATLTRNDDYWNRELGRVPYLDKLVFRVFTNTDARLLALEAGEIDVARGVPPSDIGRLANGDELATVSFDDLGFLYYAYQLDPAQTPLFQDKSVRHALYVALDRQAIVNNILGGSVAHGPHAPSSPAYRPEEFEAYAYDPDRAHTLLAEAGWTDADGDGIVEKDGQRFSFSMPYRGDVGVYGDLVAYMKEAWKAIGVDMTPEPLTFAALIQRIDAPDFEMALIGSGWSADPGMGWMFGTDANFFGYSNAEFERLEAEQRSTMDPRQRLELIVEQAKIVWDDLPIGILTFGIQNVGHTERLRNFYPNTFGGLMWSAPFWYLEG